MKSLRTDAPSQYTVQAGEPTTLWLFDKEDLLRLYGLSPEIESFGRRLLESLLIGQEEHSNLFKLHAPLERYPTLPNISLICSNAFPSPSVSDRVAQMVGVLTLEPVLEPIFHADSYGYRPNKSAHDALEQARKRCWQKDWLLGLDIKGFFDTIDHELLLRALGRHTECKWLLLYIKRWLTVPYQNRKGELLERDKGVPQGSVVGPILSNLFLHYALDVWMQDNYASVPFERYADDMICHCSSLRQAEELKQAIQARLAECKLELNEAKTRIIFCKRSGKNDTYPEIKFNFLGHTFQPRLAKSEKTGYFVSFLPAISNQAKKRINTEIRRWSLHLWTSKSLPELAELFNAKLQGWINYYGKFHKSALYPVLKRLNTSSSTTAAVKEEKHCVSCNGIFGPFSDAFFSSWTNA